MKIHKDLDVNILIKELVTIIYDSTKVFPQEEFFGMTSRIWKFAVSIPSNMPEVSARNHSKELKQFLYITFGSSSELDTLLLIANKLKLLNDEDHQVLFYKLTCISRMIQGLIKSIKANKC